MQVFMMAVWRLDARRRNRSTGTKPAGWRFGEADPEPEETGPAIAIF
jgi:hypothetical protein